MTAFLALPEVNDRLALPNSSIDRVCQPALILGTATAISGVCMVEPLPGGPGSGRRIMPLRPPGRERCPRRPSLTLPFIYEKVTSMRSISSFLVAIAVGLGGLATPAWAEKLSMAVAMDLKIFQSRATFEPSKDHPGEDWLYLTKATDDVEVAMRMQVSGEKAMDHKGRSTVSEVPGVSEGVSGYKRARVETFGKEVTLVIETKLTRMKKKDGQEVEEKEDRVDRIPLEFTSKSVTVDDLKSGRTVELRVSRAGLKVLLQSGKEKAFASMNLSAEGAKMSASASSGLLDSRRKGAVFISQERIDYEAPPTWVRARASVKINSGG